MQYYNYRSVKAMSDHRYQRIAKNRSNPGGPKSDRIWSDRIWPDRIWHDEIRQDQIPIRRRKRINNPAPDRSRAA